MSCVGPLKKVDTHLTIDTSILLKTKKAYEPEIKIVVTLILKRSAARREFFKK